MMEPEGREMAVRRSFFKIMINDFSKRLRIPPAFIKHNNVKSLEGSTLTIAGKHWQVEVNKNANDLYIEKGWQDFVRAHSLRHGDLLIFRHHHDFKFDVEIFGRNGCEKINDLADKNYDKISPSTERLETEYGRKDLANDRTNRLNGSSISRKVNGGSVVGNESEQEYKAVRPEGTHINAGMGQTAHRKLRKKMSALNYSAHHKYAFDEQDVEASCADGEYDHISHGKKAESCDIYVISSSSESENDERNKKKMKLLQHSLLPDHLYHGRTRSSSVLNKSTHIGCEKEKGKQKVSIASVPGKLSNCCQSLSSETTLLRCSLRLKSIESEKKEKMNALQHSFQQKTFPSAIEKPRGHSAVDRSKYSDPIETTKSSESQSSMNSFSGDKLLQTSQENEEDDSSSEFSSSVEKEMHANLNKNASVEESKKSSHLARRHSFRQRGSERTDENESFSEQENTQKRHCKRTPITGSRSYYLFASRRRSVTQKEKDSAMRAARKFKSDRPFFIILMMPTHVYGGFSLVVPSSFVEEHISQSVQHVSLTTSEGGKWLVRCLGWNYNRVKFGKGWKGFVWDHNLEEGDVCVFELDNSDGITFRVHIFRVVKELVPLRRIR